MATPDFTKITELPESAITSLQLKRAYSRYQFGARFCRGRDVLEVACGGGQGLGLLAKVARKVIGGDCEKKNLDYALFTYRDRPNIEVTWLDAHDLPYSEKSFDVVLLYEAIYYLRSPEQFLKEVKRILRPQGVLILCTANKDWPDFNPSPFSTHYFSVPELSTLLHQHGFDVQCYGAFPEHPNGFSAQLKSTLKRIAVRWHLMPKTMRGKVLFKRLFLGRLVKMPRELQRGLVVEEPAVLIPKHQVDTVHTAIYVVGALQ